MKLEQRLKVGTTRRDLAGLHDVLQKLVAGVRERLAGNYVGVYLQGSLATGDFDDSSDVDFLIITEDEPTEPVIAALQTFHQALYDDHPSHWAKHLEGSYIPRAALTELPPPRRRLLYLDHGSTTFEMSDHDHYLAVLWVLREQGVTLEGPEPKSLVPLIPVDALRAEVRTTMIDWAKTILCDPDEISARWYQAFAVLSYCRMAETLATGEVHSKRHGVNWAKMTMDKKWHDLFD